MRGAAPAAAAPAAGAPARPGSARPQEEVLAGLGDDLPPALFETLAAAVSPLEIAASLETCGLSNSVVRQRLGRDDVFALAEELYREVEFRPAPAADLRIKRPGGPPDLMRGVVFAAPTLMFAGAAIGLRSWLAWWTLPLALTCGWAFSQFVAYSGFSRKGRGDPAGPAVLWALLVAVAGCGVLDLAGDAVLGGRPSGALFAAAAAGFMTSSAELVAQSEEGLIGLLLLPGALGSVVFIARWPFALPTAVAVGLGGASVAATAVAALRHLPPKWWKVPVLQRWEVPTAARYFANGLCCGLYVALFMVLEPAKAGPHSWPAAAAYPMVLSLGVMEWQLRSLRAGARRALLGSYDLHAFAGRARKRLARSALCYLGVLGAMTALVQVVAHLRGVDVPGLLVGTGTCVAAAFFFALVASSCGRVDLVVRAWSAGLVVYVGGILVAKAMQPYWALLDARFAFLVAAAVTAVLLAVVAGRAVASSVCHG